jgi:hypothetical protein
MNEDNGRRRGRIASLLMGLGVVILPFILGLLGLKHQDPESEQLAKSLAAGRETRDLNVRGIILFAIGLLFMGCIALAITTGVLVVSSKQGGITFQYPPQGLANAPTPAPPAPPGLEEVPGETLGALRSSEDTLLHSYGWVDQKAGIVHIPIERAMDILAQKGLPARPPASTPFKDDGGQSPADPSSGRMQESFP